MFAVPAAYIAFRDCGDWHTGSRLETIGLEFKYRLCDGDEERNVVELRLHNYSQDNPISFHFRAFVRRQAICDDKSTDSLSATLLGTAILGPNQWSETYEGTVTKNEWTAYVYVCAYDVHDQ